MGVEDSGRLALPWHVRINKSLDLWCTSLLLQLCCFTSCGALSSHKQCLEIQLVEVINGSVHNDLLVRLHILGGEQVADHSYVHRLLRHAICLRAIPWLACFPHP